MVTTFDPYSFRIGDTTHLSPYIARGIVTQYKKPVSVNARPLSATLQQPLSSGVESPMFSSLDGSKCGRGISLHLALQAMWQYESIHGRTPPVGNAVAAEEVVGLAHGINALYKGVQAHCGPTFATAVDEVDVDVVRTYALYYSAELQVGGAAVILTLACVNVNIKCIFEACLVFCVFLRRLLQPLCAFFGGIAAQEVIKVCSKFQPMDQWLHYDCFEVLPSEPPADTAPTGSRYDHQVSVFGAMLQEKLMVSVYVNVHDLFLGY